MEQIQSVIKTKHKDELKAKLENLYGWNLGINFETLAKSDDDKFTIFYNDEKDLTYISFKKAENDKVTVETGLSNEDIQKHVFVDEELNEDFDDKNTVYINVPKFIELLDVLQTHIAINAAEDYNNQKINLYSTMENIRELTRLSINIFNFL